MVIVKSFTGAENCVIINSILGGIHFLEQRYPEAKNQSKTDNSERQPQNGEY